MSDDGAPSLGRWAWLALLVACGTVLLADVNRFLPEAAERYVNVTGIGSSDLIPSLNAALALRSGQNPYHSDPVRLPDPYAASRGAEEHVTFLYPPSHMLVYLPVVYFAGHNFVPAARFQFFVGLIAIVVLALALLDLLCAALPISPDLRPALLALFVFVLGANPGNLLGLERGQSDIVTAALCWWGVAAFRRERFGSAAFLLMASTLLKGYGLSVATGLLLLSLRRHAWRRALLGALLAILLLLAPVARYLPDAIAVYPIRARMFWSGWTNQSFYNLVYIFNPHYAAIGRYVLVGIACAIALLTWFRLRQVLQVTANASERAMALGRFTTAALIPLVAGSFNSIAYNGVLVLPGALLIAMTHGRLDSPARSPLAKNLLGALVVVTLFGLCAFSAARLFGRGYAREMPTHAAGLVGLMLLIALSSLRRAARVR
jgi:hypothetical protein